MTNKVIIFSAPSGSGKSTIVNHLLSKFPKLAFSISATSRAPRGEEEHGKEYYFYSSEEFKDLIQKEAFVEYEEVYSGSFYGTLRSELERLWSDGRIIVFDIDVVGAVNLKKVFGENALSIFIKAPSIEELEKRLSSRGTDSKEEIEKRLTKSKQELEFEKHFDTTIINDKLEQALEQAEKTIDNFIKKN